jgi:hypothetical protein
VESILIRQKYRNRGNVLGSPIRAPQYHALHKSLHDSIVAAYALHHIKAGH